MSRHKDKVMVTLKTVAIYLRYRNHCNLACDLSIQHGASRKTKKVY